MALFQDDAARSALRNMLFDCFKKWFVLDPTHASMLRVRFSGRAPNTTSEEQSWDKEAREFHGAATPIEEASDGVRAFTGLLCALFAKAHRVILIDEPEAFLHPPLARRLGQYVAQLSDTTQANVLIATHSADFLMGCVQSGVPVNIVRLTYDGLAGTSRLISAGVVSDLMKDPLLRSTGVLSALFHTGAVITEAAADSAFYGEINHRLVTVRDEGLDGLVFLNAQNKQTTWRIAKPLRDAGVPAAMVVDMDVFKEGGTPWGNLLDGANVPDAQRGSMGQFRGDIMRVFKEKGLDPKHVGALARLPHAERESVKNLVAQLAEYGLFVVPVGELECWLSHLSATGRKGEWLADVFGKMGSDPKDAAYLQPGDGDVWAFIRDIAAWVRNPVRKGMPG